MFRGILFGFLLCLVLVAIIHWAPVLMPSMHWWSFFAGVGATIVTAIVVYYTFLILALNRR